MDREFPPEASSLYNRIGSKLHKNELKLWKSFVWKRPIDFMPGEPKLFVGGIDPDSITEGYLGNTYFISILRALSERATSIKKLFDVKASPKDGQYFVNFSLNGENYKVEIDDFVPY